MKRAIVILLTLLNTAFAQTFVTNENRISGFLRNQDYDGLLAYLQTIPDSAQNINTRGYLSYANYMLGNLRGAEIHYRKMLDDDSENVEANRFLAAIYATLNPVESEQYFHKLISLEPEKAAPYRDLGDLWFRRGNADSAFANFRSAYRTSPSDIRSVARYTGMLLALKKYESADSVLRILGSSRDSLNPVFLRLSLQSAYESKKFANGIAPGELLLKLHEISNPVMNQLVITYYILRKFEDCLRVVNYLTLNKTANDLTLFYGSQSLAAMRQYKPSSELLRDCLSLAISPMAETYWFQLGQNFEHEGAFKKAIAQYDTAYYLFHNPFMLYNIGRVYESNLKNPKKADLFFHRFLIKADARKPNQQAALEYVKRRFKTK